MKSAFIAIVGRPSAGKSTLINALCGHKVSIISPVPQTTRNTVRGILNEERGQIVFLDTPGFHVSDKRYNLKLSDLVRSSLGDADLVLYLIDGYREPGEEEETIAGLIKKSEKPLVIAVNKIDLGAQAQVLEFLQKTFPEAQLKTAPTSPLQAATPSAARTTTAASPEAALAPQKLIYISAEKGTGLDELKTLLFEHVSEGHAWYPEDYYTDQDPDFRIAEIIREQVMNRTREEIPHSAFVDIEDLDLRLADGSNAGPDFDASTVWDMPDEEKPQLTIRAFICVERDSQKGIVIGAGGKLIKAIRVGAEKQLREIFPYHIELDLRVKVSPKWRNDEKLLGRIIH